MFTGGLTAVSSLLAGILRRTSRHIALFLTADVAIGKNPARVSAGTIIFFPCRSTVLFCGIAGMVAYKQPPPPPAPTDMESLGDLVARIESRGSETRRQLETVRIDRHFLGGNKTIELLDKSVQALKCRDAFFTVFNSAEDRRRLADYGRRLTAAAAAEARLLAEHMGRLDATRVERMAACIEKVRDIAWCIQWELLENIKKIENLYTQREAASRPGAVAVFKNQLHIEQP